ncbi:TIGR03086 family metal-binding protein [Streptomyces sp. NPDC004609]|uniref:TIGR03086 family metal-binding protein n=1 Tax=Streptomyces sp. NPDC004609 TaxID=3364704 RepID=UPI0036B4BEE3
MSSRRAGGLPCTEPTATPFPGLRPAADAVARLLVGVRDDRLGDPTPCPDYAVRELLGHPVGLTTAFRDAGRKDLGETTGVDPGDALPVLEDGWRDVLPRRLDETAQAWADPAAWEGETEAGSVGLPAAVAGRVALNELVIHGWDLARATRQRYAPGEASLRGSYAPLEAAGDDDPMRGTIFGPIVDVPEGAPLLDRVVALSGRRPDWRPGERAAAG